MSLPQHSRNPSNGHLCCWKPAVVTFFLFFFHLLCPLLLCSVQSGPNWAERTCPHHHGSAPEFPWVAWQWVAWLSWSCMCILKNCLCEVMGREGGAWEDWAWVGGRSKFRQWQENCYGAHLEVPEARNLISALLFLTLSVTLAELYTLRRKMGVISACQRGVLFQS